MRVPVRYTVRYTELGTVILGRGRVLIRSTIKYTELGTVILGGGWEFDSCIWVEIGG